MSRPKTVLEDYFWQRIEKTGGCWLWLGNKRYGYGLIRMGAAGKGGMAHRISWQLHNGVIPRGSYVLHRCNNPTCVNPDHLYLGTQLDNIQQAKREGRMRRGETQGTSKLKESDVTNIRILDLPRQKLADLYGVSYMQIKNIKTRKHWTHI